MMIEANRLKETAMRKIAEGETYKAITEALKRASEKGCLGVAVAITADLIKVGQGEKIDEKSLVPYIPTLIALRNAGFLVEESGNFSYPLPKKENAIIGEIVQIGEEKGACKVYFVYILSAKVSENN